MINITFKNKEDLSNFKTRLRAACDKKGVRLGKAPNRIDEITAEAFGYRDHNTLIAAVCRDDKEHKETTEDLSLFAERVAVPSTTHGATSEIIGRIKSGKDISKIIFGVRDGNPNNSALTAVLVARSGSYIFDTTNITAERTPREFELLDIFNTIKDMNCLGLTRYINKRLPDTRELPSTAAFDTLTTYALKPVFPDWEGFLAMFNKELTRYPNGIHRDEEWEALAKAVS